MKRTGLELTATLTALIGFLITTAIVVSGVSQNGDLQSAIEVNQYYLGSAGTLLMVLLTNYGREVVWGLVVVVLFLVGNKPTKLLAVELALLFIAGIVVGDVAKAVYFRPRPYLFDPTAIILRVAGDLESAYPSGHALIVSIGATFCLARFRHKTVAAVLAVEAALVCYSRVYVGVHYPLDVVGGVFLGVAIAIIGSLAIEKYLSRFIGNLLQPFLALLREGPLDI